MSASFLKCTKDGTIVDIRNQITRESAQIGDRVAIAIDERITRELWHVPGTITEIRPAGAREHRRETRYFVEFDEPTKAVGALLTGLWVKIDQML